MMLTAHILYVPADRSGINLEARSETHVGGPLARSQSLVDCLHPPHRRPRCV